MTRSTAVLSGTVNPGGIATTYHFAYVEAAGYQPGAEECSAGLACAYAQGRTTPESESIGSDYTAHPTGLVLVSELKPGTTYDYALVASNSEDTTIGPNESFTTSPPTPPTATTGAAVGVSQFSGRITGTVNTRELPATEQFEFGPTPYGDSFVPAQIESATESTVNVAAMLGGTLQPGTTYYYRMIASNPDGTAYGAEQSFTTPGYPAAFTGAPAPAFVPYATIPELSAKEAKEDKSIPNPTTKKKTKTKKKNRNSKGHKKHDKKT